MEGVSASVGECGVCDRQDVPLRKNGGLAIHDAEPGVRCGNTDGYHKPRQQPQGGLSVGIRADLGKALAALDAGNRDEARRRTTSALEGLAQITSGGVSLSVWHHDDGRVALCFNDHRAPVRDHEHAHHEPPVSTDGASCSCGWVHFGIVHLLAGPARFMDKPSVAQRIPQELTATMIVWR